MYGGRVQTAKEHFNDENDDDDDGYLRSNILDVRMGGKWA